MRKELLLLTVMAACMISFAGCGIKVHEAKTHEGKNIKIYDDDDDDDYDKTAPEAVPDLADVNAADELEEEINNLLEHISIECDEDDDMIADLDKMVNEDINLESIEKDFISNDFAEELVSYLKKKKLSRKCSNDDYYFELCILGSYKWGYDAYVDVCEK